MNTNEDTRVNAPEDLIVLGVASVDTKGPLSGTEPMGPGGFIPPGIAAE